MGETLNTALVELFDHTYEVAPFAVSVAVTPEQIAVVEGVIVTVGNGFTVTVFVTVAVHPTDEVPVIV